MTRVFFGETYGLHKHFSKLINEHSEIQGTPLFYEMSREEQMAHLMKVYNACGKDPELKKAMQSFTLTTNFTDYF